MAVRNLYYEGGQVEQPYYNGMPLTAWYHEGVMVWGAGEGSGSELKIFSICQYPHSFATGITYTQEQLRKVFVLAIKNFHFQTNENEINALTPCAGVPICADFILLEGSFLDGFRQVAELPNFCATHIIPISYDKIMIAGSGIGQDVNDNTYTYAIYNISSETIDIKTVTVPTLVKDNRRVLYNTGRINGESLAYHGWFIVEYDTSAYATGFLLCAVDAKMYQIIWGDGSSQQWCFMVGDHGNVRYVAFDNSNTGSNWVRTINYFKMSKSSGGKGDEDDDGSADTGNTIPGIFKTVNNKSCFYICESNDYTKYTHEIKTIPMIVNGANNISNGVSPCQTTYVRTQNRGISSIYYTSKYIFYRDFIQSGVYDEVPVSMISPYTIRTINSLTYEINPLNEKKAGVPQRWSVEYTCVAYQNSRYGGLMFEFDDEPDWRIGLIGLEAIELKHIFCTLYVKRTISEKEHYITIYIYASDGVYRTESYKLEDKPEASIATEGQNAVRIVSYNKISTTNVTDNFINLSIY